MGTSERSTGRPAADAPLSSRRQWAALAVLLLPVLIISIDNTVLGFAVPELSEDLAPTSAQLLWIVDIYAFVLAGLLVTMGTLGDRVGRRQRRLDDPMLDVGLFSHRSFSVAVGTNLLGNVALIGSLFFVAQYLQIVLGVGPLGAGLHLLPGMLASMAASVGVVAILGRGVGSTSCSRSRSRPRPPASRP